MHACSNVQMSNHMIRKKEKKQKTISTKGSYRKKMQIQDITVQNQVRANLLQIKQRKRYDI